MTIGSVNLAAQLLVGGKLSRGRAWVGIYSAVNWGETGGPNANGGGDPLSELINHARTVEP